MRVFDNGALIIFGGTTKMIIKNEKKTTSDTQNKINAAKG